MAMADVAVEMGPRNRRRVTKAAIAVAVIAAFATGALLTRPSNHVGSVSGRSTQVGPSASGAHMYFGMSAQQVRRITGKPAAVEGSCWVFHPTTAGMIGSYSLGVRSIPGEAVKMCFDGGALSYGSQRIFWKGKWMWVGWVPQLTVVHPPSQ